MNNYEFVSFMLSMTPAGTACVWKNEHFWSHACPKPHLERKTIDVNMSLMVLYVKLLCPSLVKFIWIEVEKEL